MKKLSPIAYRALFFKHVWRFMGNVTRPEELRRPHAVAVSGGMDSMALLWVAKVLRDQGKIGPIRALFVNHHTREGQDLDGFLVQMFCKQEGIPFKVLHAEGLSRVFSNFEEQARRQRRQLLLNELSTRERLWQAHHLDDSYEWFIMQRSRSNNPKATIGIPVRNGVIIRPFLCVSRRQIKRLANFEGIPFREDPTNRDLRHDRNYVRFKIVPPIRKRYPQYLKHYANTSNFATMHLRMNLSAGQVSKIYVYEQGAVLLGKHFSEIQIQELIHNYSNTDRGEIVGPIHRMLKGIDNGKKGPFHFSGGMEAYHSYNLLMIYSQGMKNHDLAISKILNGLSEDQLAQMPFYKRIELEHAWNNFLRSSDAMLSMPGLVLVLENESICKTLNTSVFDPLFPEFSQVCKARGLRFMSYLKCIEIWKAKKEKLPERLRLLPVYNLSNLFPSQQ